MFLLREAEYRVNFTLAEVGVVLQSHLLGNQIHKYIPFKEIKAINGNSFKLGETNGFPRQSNCAAPEGGSPCFQDVWKPMRKVLGSALALSCSALSPALLACYFFQFAKHMISSSH